MSDNESEDTLNVADLDPRTTPLYKTSPERIWLAICDEFPGIWQLDFNTYADVTWYTGEPPVSVTIGYVRADLYDALQSQLAAANERADGLQRIVDEARAQKPVALVAQHGGYAWSRQLHWEPGVDKQAIPAGTKLYADAPVPAQPAVVPKHAADRFHDMREVLFDIATSDVICDRPEHAFVTVAIDRDTLSRAAILSATEVKNGTQ